MEGTGDNRTLKTYNFYDKMTLLKVEGKRIEYGVLTKKTGNDFDFLMGRRNNREGDCKVDYGCPCWSRKKPKWITNC